MSKLGKGDTNLAGLIDVQTTRYSELVTRILNEYRVDTVVAIDGREFPCDTFDKVLADWCTNARISKSRNFVLSRKGLKLFGFHDHPREFWAAASELSFIQRLADDGIIRYQICTRK